MEVYKGFISGYNLYKMNWNWKFPYKNEYYMHMQQFNKVNIYILFNNIILQLK